MGSNQGDKALWCAEYLRQYQCVKTALHSLRRQSEAQRSRKPLPKAVQDMEHTFQMVDAAFNALNTPEPSNHDPDGDYLPGPGRRQFISDLKHGEVRT